MHDCTALLALHSILVQLSLELNLITELFISLIRRRVSKTKIAVLKRYQSGIKAAQGAMLNGQSGCKRLWVLLQLSPNFLSPPIQGARAKMGICFEVQYLHHTN